MRKRKYTCAHHVCLREWICRPDHLTPHTWSRVFTIKVLATPEVDKLACSIRSSGKEKRSLPFHGANNTAPNGSAGCRKRDRHSDTIDCSIVLYTALAT